MVYKEEIRGGKIRKISQMADEKKKQYIEIISIVKALRANHDQLKSGLKMGNKGGLQLTKGHH